MTADEEIKKQISLLAAEIKVLSDGLTKYMVILLSILENLKNRQATSVVKEKRFHDFVISEYSKSKKERVYCFLYFNPRLEVRRLVLAHANSFEQAKDVANVIMVEEGEDLNDWLIEGNQYINIPKTEEKRSNGDIEKSRELKKDNISSFLLSLRYISDKHASQKEKVALNSIIKKLKQKYATKQLG